MSDYKADIEKALEGFSVEFSSDEQAEILERIKSDCDAQPDMDARELVETIMRRCVEAICLRVGEAVAGVVMKP